MDVTKHFQDAYPIHFHSHVIIDRVIYPNLPITWNASPIITEMIAPQAHLYPFLVDLRHLDSEQIPILQKMIIDSKKNGGIILIKSHYDHNTLIYLLANALIYAPKTGGNYLLRYYDHNVMLQLIRIIPHNHLFNKIKSLGIDFFTFHSRFGHITYLPELVETTFNDNKNNTLALLSNIGIINKAIKKLNNDMDIATCLKVSQRLDDKITIAHHEFYLTDANDIMSFITQCILVHDFYYQSPQIINLLKETSQYPGYFHESLSLLSIDDWNNILAYCENTL
ncbi:MULTISPECIES: hypothetical protein [Providencia]|uniref:hypothetical protein n=1 Tax=Providencia TaxID=586 RepID=UPI0018C731E2|nr:MULTISPECIES: hypothetical protein [Providencia]MBG5900581.1 hypothetical protein [Providencia rettgeri]MBI6191992.1 hypothetical protein [Providencia rettgeri]MBQ0396845.1 hypothetical protein [Providencia rettgeri]